MEKGYRVTTGPAEETQWERKIEGKEKYVFLLTFPNTVRKLPSITSNRSSDMNHLRMVFSERFCYQAQPMSRLKVLVPKKAEDTSACAPRPSALHQGKLIVVSFSRRSSVISKYAHFLLRTVSVSIQTHF